MSSLPRPGRATLLRVPLSDLRAGPLDLPPEAARYVAKVHRKRAGDALLLFDPLSGTEAEAVIEADQLPDVRVCVGPPRAAPNYAMPVELWAAVSKQDKPEQAVRDATAMGAERLVLFSAERSVAKGEGDARRARLLRVAEQVARQCGRGRLPQIVGPHPLGELLAECSPEDGALRLVCALHATSRPLLRCVQELDWDACRVSVVVGPEGGLSDSEVEACRSVGFVPVELGPYVLRAEAACGAVLAVLRAAWWADQVRTAD